MNICIPLSVVNLPSVSLPSGRIGCSSPLVSLGRLKWQLEPGMAARNSSSEWQLEMEARKSVSEDGCSWGFVEGSQHING